MENLARNLIMALFLAMAGAFVLFLVNFAMKENAGYGIPVVTSLIFLIIIAGIIGISYFFNRGKV